MLIFNPSLNFSYRQLPLQNIFLPANFFAFFCLVNWEAIKVEISCSNVIQRDNLTFAKALDKGLMDIAKENDDTVS